MKSLFGHIKSDKSETATMQEDFGADSDQDLEAPDPENSFAENEHGESGFAEAGTDYVSTWVTLLGASASLRIAAISRHS